jgi:adenylate cyclase, class 2
VLHQIDTYFHSRIGRLKLREIREGRSCRAELIAYDRPDRASARESRYHVVPVADAAAMRSALESVLAIRAVVRKRRELWMYHNVRVHLDRVEELGSFVEFEAVLGQSANQALSRKRLRKLCEALSIGPRDQIARSYVDLLTSNL